MHPDRLPNPGRSPDPLEARLRALAPPPVPNGLEARLLATVPMPRYHRYRRATVAAALAAACLLAVVARARHDAGSPVTPEHTPIVAVPPVPDRPVDSPVAVTARMNARRDLDVAAMPTFAWPLEESSPVSARTPIPPDLLD